MITFSLRFHLSVTTQAADDVLSDHVGQVMAALVDLSAADGLLLDPAVALDLGAREVEVELLVAGETAGQAADYGFNAIRAAIHAAGGYTPGWGGTEPHDESVEYGIHNLELQPA